jgi:2-methylisocitrate lyase-like PEP mutase family enzyme
MSADAAAAFRGLHRAGTPLLLPNAWDVASGAALAEAGFRAIGTTSLGVAAAHGLPDGTGATREQTVALARGLTRLPVLVTLDIEAGFSDVPAEVAALAAELATLGVVGVNLEDGRPDGLMAPDRQAALIGAVRRRVPDLFINARIDTHWLVAEPPALSETLGRAARYVSAGADGIFVPGLTEPADIATVVAAVGAPVNILYSPNSHTLADLATLGVRRVSTGSLLFRAAIHALVATAARVRDGGTVPEDLPSYGDIQRLADAAAPSTRENGGPGR